jgi:hypothetical protein
MAATSNTDGKRGEEREKEKSCKLMLWRCIIEWVRDSASVEWREKILRSKLKNAIIVKINFLAIHLLIVVIIARF